MALDTLVNRVPFSKNGLQVLAGMYLGGLLLRWDQYDLFNSLFDAGVDLDMFLLRWDFSTLLGEMLLVINPGKANTFLLRLNMAPEHLWLGIHWAGTPETGIYISTQVCGNIKANHLVPISAYLTSLADLLSDRPLLAGAVLHRTDPVNQQWQTIIGALLHHLDSVSARCASNPTASAVDMEMSGVEYSPPCHADTIIRDLSPDMDLCDGSTIDPAAAIPSAPAMGSCAVNKSPRHYRAARSPSPDYAAAAAARKKYRARC
ncbi:unnamed protein product [Penicillium salamii]|nr:unnamed protein product [Penicillium salamii]CAG8188192.1 unnamed protein product [Penicillium salamii]CAG8383806.1 unnamed protein product [Penicillium salamii]